MNTRRQLLLASVASLAALATTPLHAVAPRGKSFAVGVLTPIVPTAMSSVSTLQSALQERGYLEGVNLRLEVRSAESQSGQRLTALALELIDAKVDVIVSVGTPATLAAQKATSRVPIIAVNVTDPVAAGLTASLARPSGNVTGFTNLGVDSIGKRVELMHALVPKARRVGMMYNPDNPGNVVLKDGIVAQEKALGTQLAIFATRSRDELHRVLDNLPNAQLDALYVPLDAVFTNNLKEIADFAGTHRLPAFSSNPQFVKLGGLASYSSSQTEMQRNAADYVDRILNGAKAGDLPFVQPTKVELSLNRATAKALGITIPADLLLRADFVVD